MLQAMPLSAPDRPQRPRSARRLLRTGVALLALLGVGAYLLFQYATSPPAEGCTARVGEQHVDLEVNQAANAATIAAVATARGLPERAVTIALATAMQESHLENIRYGDRDSLGLFQQRPSQGWGTEKQILDPVYSTNEFFEALEEVAGYSRLPLTVAAQKVQRSGYPQAYAKHEPEAAVLAAALTGRSAGALRCTVNTASRKESGNPDKVAAKVEREFADALGPVARDGAALAYAPAGEGTEARRRGWALAQWAMAHARSLRIERVAYGDREWTLEKSHDGWRERKADASSGNSLGRVTITVAQYE